MKCIVLGNL